MFSYAIVIFELISGERPYKELQDSFRIFFFTSFTHTYRTNQVHFGIPGLCFSFAFLLTLTETLYSCRFTCQAGATNCSLLG